MVLDSNQRWASAIQLELVDVLQEADLQVGSVVFETCQTARDVNDICDAPNISGLILFFAGQEREVLGLLRTVWNQSPHLDVMVVCESRHHDLMPVIMESGVSCVLNDVKNDVPIAQWCYRVLSGHVGSDDQV